MFVIFRSNEINSHNECYDGLSVSILSADKFKDKWIVGAYTKEGFWDEWVAHVNELDGFDGVI